MSDIAALATLDIPRPTRTPVSEPFWAAAAEGRLLLQHCPACGGWVFYPRGICPHCWSPDLHWRQASGHGRLLTWSTQHRPGHPGWAPAAPYTVGLVGLDEGPTMLSHILAPPQRLEPDLPLHVRFVRIGADTLPFFAPAP